MSIVYYKKLQNIFKKRFFEACFDTFFLQKRDKKMQKTLHFASFELSKCQKLNQKRLNARRFQDGLAVE
jgi:hypothetical protein